jgi:hypothetical protein
MPRRPTRCVAYPSRWSRSQRGAPWKTFPGADRLTVDLDPPGFDTLAVMMGGKTFEAEKVLLFRTPKPAVEDPAPMRACLLEAVQAAEKARREADRDAERAESALAKANARVAAVGALREAKEAARLASSEAKKAAQAVEEAERSLAKAKGRLET